MKKIISILFLVAFVASATFGQFGRSQVEPVVKGDTIINGTTFSKIINVTGGYNQVTFQVNVKKIGTLATAVSTWVKLYGSLDGNYWYNWKTNKALDSVKLYFSRADSLNTVLAVFLGTKISYAPYTYYKVAATNDSTGKGAVKIFDVFRKPTVTISTP